MLLNFFVYEDLAIKLLRFLKTIVLFFAEVKSDCVVLKDGAVLPCGLVVWSTGLAPRPLTAGLDVDRNSHGQILTDNNLNILSDPSKDSFAIGDCADIIDMPLPCTAQVKPCLQSARKPANQQVCLQCTSRPVAFVLLGHHNS